MLFLKLYFSLKGNWTSSKEPQDPGPSSLEETLTPQTDQLERTDPQPKLTNPNSEQDPAPVGPATAGACCSSPAPFTTESPAKADCSAQSKKKKGFFSKGKKLLKKLGSSKKE